MVDLLKNKANVECKVVSVGSTPTCSHLPKNMGKITEIHPGMIFCNKSRKNIQQLWK